MKNFSQNILIFQLVMNNLKDNEIAGVGVGVQQELEKDDQDKNKADKNFAKADNMMAWVGVYSMENEGAGVRVDKVADLHQGSQNVWGLSFDDFVDF